MAMVPPDAPGGGRWTLLGQSFGGFCAARSLLRAFYSAIGSMISDGLLLPKWMWPCLSYKRPSDIGLLLHFDASKLFITVEIAVLVM